MTSLSSPRVGALCLCAVLLSAGVAFAQSSSTTKAGNSTATKSGTAARGGSAKGPLPDPALLDGSTQPAEKRSETGMIGDFELPGDENAPRNGKVGGPQNPGGQQGGGGQQQQQMGLPQSGGSQGAQGAQQGGQQGGAQGAQAQAGGQQGGAQGGAQDGAAQAGGAQAGNQGTADAQGGQANGQAQGQQVGSLGGDASSSDPGGAAGGSQKPGAVMIGDKAMRIETSAPAADIVGAQTPAGPTQAHEKGTGSGGKGGSGSSGNKGVERGRAIPAGL